MLEAWHRARDIMLTDRTDSNVRTSMIVSRYLSLLKDMHEFVTRRDNNSDVNSDNKLKEKFAKIEQEYDRLAHQRGAIIHDIIRIERTEESRYLFEDADFSVESIKKLIMQGERDAEKALVKNK
jgi:NTE family protein